MTRVIRKSRNRASEEAAALLEAVFATELASASRCLWVVSPWVSDVPLIDNRSGSFGALEAWGPRWVRLSEVLLTLARSGTFVVIGTTEAESNAGFLSRLRTSFADDSLSDRLLVDIDASNELHEKSIITDDAVIVGSMNITNNGIFVREEYVELRIDEAYVARSRMDAFDRYGGVM